MYGMPALDDPLGTIPVELGGLPSAGSAAPEHAAPPLHMVQVQRGDLPTSSAPLCLVCDPPDDDKAAAVVAEAVAAGQVAVCTEQWLQGVRLDADGQQWLCWVERLY